MTRLACLLFLLPALAAASQPDYAWEWPLQPARDGAGAYRVELTPSIYEAAVDPALRDLDVLDAGGEPVAAALFGAETPDTRDAALVALPWFPLPPAAEAGTAPRWRIRTETGPDRQLQRVETELLDPAAQTPEATGLLVDASSLEGRIQALEFDWPTPPAPLDARYRIESSQDLETWRVVGEGRLVDLTHAGHRIQQRRIATGAGASARYFRLFPLDPGRRAEVSAVRAVPAAMQAETVLSWIALRGTREEVDGRVEVVFALPGRYPVEQADVRVGANSTSEWSLESRDGPDQAWRQRLPSAVAWRLDDGGGESRSPPRALGRTSRDREWRLVARGPVRGTPELHMGYRAEHLVFLAEGEPPYVLVAGSGRAQRADAPVQRLLAAQRSARGEDWKPADATIGARKERAGAIALAPAPAPRDWTRWLLWALLVAGALLVGGLALSLLRRASP